MNTMMTMMYTTAQMAPMHSGSSCLLFTLAMSRPFSPALMNAGPSHLIMAYVAANANPLREMDAIRASPSPWNVLARMVAHTRVTAARLSVSALLRADDSLGVVDMVENRRPSCLWQLGGGG